jgi:hypothetical protein
VTHGYIWYLAERLVLEVRRLLVLAATDVDGDEFIRDVALFGYQGHAARAGEV